MSAFTMSLQEASEIFGNELKDFGLDTFPTPEGFEADKFREGLGRKIIDHYWNREIGLESFSMWRFNMRRAMNEIMPYYCKLYASEKIKFDPLSTMDMTSNATAKQDTEATSNSASSGNAGTSNVGIASVYPQTAIGQNRTGNYATNGEESKSNTEQSTTADESQNASNESTSSSSTKGYAGSAAALLTEYRNTLLNLDMAVIDDEKINELFLSVLSTPNTYTGGFFL